MTDVKSILNDDEFFVDINDTPKDDIEQHNKRECLRSAISNGKVLEKNSGHMKELIKPATKLLIKHMLNTSNAN